VPQRAAAFGVEVDLQPRFLHVERQVYEHRTAAALLGSPERLPEGPHELAWLLDLHGPLGDGPRDLHNIHRLEGLFVENVRRGLSGDADLGDGVGHTRVEAGDHIRPRWS
jgi:hypothetical protein